MTSTEGGDVPHDLTLRLATPQDVPAIAELHLEARRAAVPTMPPPVHTDAEVLAYHRERVAAGEDLWVAEQGGHVVAYLHLAADWLDALYVRPGHAGQGIGTELLDLVKALRPRGFALWVFESNEPARRFYRRHGLVELEHTDGSANEERSPDLRMAWPGADPAAYFQRQVDEVDAEAAVLESRRAALTAALEGIRPERS